MTMMMSLCMTSGTSSSFIGYYFTSDFVSESLFFCISVFDWSSAGIVHHFTFWIKDQTAQLWSQTGLEFNQSL